MTKKRIACVIEVVLGAFVSVAPWLSYNLAADENVVRPNIVLLLADDLGYGELGCQGNPQIPTPRIDSIAARGMRCTQAYVSASYCSASRAGLLTGRYQMRFGYEFNPIGPQNDDPNVGLPNSQRTLADHLQRSGYATALIGKWHLGASAAYHPLLRGFDEFYGFLHEGHFYVPPPYRGVTTMLRRRALPDGGQGRWTGRDLILSTHMGNSEPAYDAGNPLIRGGQPVVEPAYLTRAFAREAVDFIHRQRDRPFFLYLAFNAVHSPLQAENKVLERFNQIDDMHRRIFAGMLSGLDDGVGQVLDALQSEQIANRTLVFFLSDNGGPTRELTSSNLPLRGGKGDMYEGGIRIPFLVKWPGVIPAGRVYENPVISFDILATALAAAGVKRPSSPTLDGVDLRPFLTGRNATRPHRELFWRSGRRTAARSGDWKLVRNPRGGREKTDWQLYDLASDISETHDLIDARPDRFEELKAVWTRFDQQMSDPFWTPGRK